MTTQWKMTCALAALAGCGGVGGDEATGSAVAAIETVPASVRCVRLTLRGATRSFDVAGGAGASLALGPQAPGTMTVTGAAYDVACADVTGMTAATWVSEATSVTIAAGLTTDFVLTMRPNSSVNGRVNFAQPARAIAAAGSSSYAVLLDGTVRAWGENTAGQLGDGATALARRSPVVVASVANARSVAAGIGHACARTASSEVLCWGFNAFGALGDGTTTSRLTAAPIAAGSPPFAQLSAGAYYTCGVTDEEVGRVFCWGENADGQLADGTTVTRLVPTYSNTSDASSAHAGERYTACAVLNDAGVRCWGDNSRGQFGNGATSTTAATIAVNTSYTAVRSFAVGSEHTCAATHAGAVLCAGQNLVGQLGDGTTADHASPATVPGLSDVLQVAAGNRHTCARRRDGTVWCWGGGEYGQIGDGHGVNASGPQQVSGLSQVTDLAAGQFHTCALRTDGSVWCWGANDRGQIGDGTARRALTPVPVRL